MKRYRQVISSLFLAIFTLSIPATGNANEAWQITKHLLNDEAKKHFSKRKSFQRKVKINRDFLDSLIVGSNITLPVFANKTVQVTIHRIEYQKGIKTLIGKINSTSFPFVMTLGEMGIYANFVTPQGSYQLEASNLGGVLNHRLFYARPLNGLKKDYLLPPKDEEKPDELGPNQSLIRSNATIKKSVSEPLMMNTTPVILKWLVAYTDAAKASHNDIAAKLNQLVATTNQIYVDSGMEIRLELVHSFQTAINNSTSTGNILSGLRDKILVDWDVIAQNRIQYQADFVTVMKANDGSVCGRAWLNGDAEKNPSDELTNVVFDYSYSYSVVDINCANDTTAHEIGHNLGLAHSSAQNEAGVLQSYGRGHGVNGNFTTVMAYPSAYAGASGVFFFSNPNLSICNALPCGIPHDQSDGADAVRVINNIHTKTAAAQIFDENDPPVLFATALTNISDENLKTCLNNAYPSGFDSYEFTFLNCPNLPISELTGLDQFTRVETLNIWSSNNVDDLTPLANLDSLTWFQINSNNIPCWQKNVMQNRNLEYLNIAGSCTSTPNDNEDNDNDGIINVNDPDDDNDGLDDLKDQAPDTDGDGIQDDQDTDDDNDGMSDEYENLHGLNPLFNDADDDTDGDGLSNFEEFQLGTSASSSDTDGDGMNDGYEQENGLNPLMDDSATDSDNDGLTALQELQFGTDPNNADSDGDILSDSEEISEGRDPLVYESCPASPCGLPIWLYELVK